MKVLVLLLDGVGDRAYKTLKDLTPLQAAVTPNLNRLAGRGSNGLFHASLSGQCLPSETAHYLIFGYRLSEFPGRGLLEAVGEGVPFENDDVLSLAHLAGIAWKKGQPVLMYGRDHIEGSAKEIGELMGSLTPFETDGILFQLFQTRRNDAVLLIRGPASPFISDSDPILQGRPIAEVKPLLGNPEYEIASRTARALNTYLAFCHRILTHHDINRKKRREGRTVGNFLVTQRCGRRVRSIAFRERWGFQGLIIASGSVYAGIAHELGFDFARVKDSRDPGDDLRDRVHLALEDASHDFIHVHTKVPDEASHKGDAARKRDVISDLDRGLVDLVKIMERREDILLVVMADHSTPSQSVLIHSGEPVPLCFVGKHVRRDAVQQYDEVNCSQGCLGFLRGEELMHMVLNYSDRSSLFGHCIGAVQRPYAPGDYDWFKRGGHRISKKTDKRLS
jgi:2,3-bisphosphoglycerate-independent phosphoglycerate mutase